MQQTISYRISLQILNSKWTKYF